MPWNLPLWLLSRSARDFRRRRLETWTDTAMSCGLRLVDSSSQRAPRLKIEARTRPVTVRIEEQRSHAPGIQVTAVFPGPRGFSDLRIRRLKPGTSPGTREGATGDESFDEAFSIEGPPRLLSALLDAEMRRLLTGAQPASRLEISRGAIRLETSDGDLPDVLPFLLDISRRLAQRVDTAQALAENALRDPEPRVRLRNLSLLAETPGAAGAIETLHAACSDESPQIRLRAAVELGARGRDVLLELAESLVDDTCSAQAVSRLGRELPAERACALLAAALDRRLLQTARACLEALGRSGNPAAEPPLLQVLQNEVGDLQMAAVHALARTGTAAAVPLLQEAAGWFPDDAPLQSATSQAIAAIQSRLQGASPGQLSVAEAEAGQLSLAQAEAGQLSLATDPAGRLSLPPET